MDKIRMLVIGGLVVGLVLIASTVQADTKKEVSRDLASQTKEIDTKISTLEEFVAVIQAQLADVKMSQDHLLKKNKENIDGDE